LPAGHTSDPMGANLDARWTARDGVEEG